MKRNHTAGVQANTVKPQYNDMSREPAEKLYRYIEVSYIETPDITILLQNNPKYRYIGVKGVNETETQRSRRIKWIKRHRKKLSTETSEVTRLL